MHQNDTTFLTSPGYPQPYAINTYCSWLVIAEGTGHPKLTILDFEIDQGYDFVFIGNDAGIDIISLTGRLENTPSSVTANSSRLWVYFDSFNWVSSLTGFQFHLSWFPPQNSKLRCYNVIPRNIFHCARTRTRITTRDALDAARAVKSV